MKGENIAGSRTTLQDCSPVGKRISGPPGGAAPHRDHPTASEPSESLRSPSFSVSFIVPVHDRADPDVLRRCLEGIGSARRPGDEIIVTVDGPAERLVAVSERLGALVVRNPVRSGPATARNRGAATASGEVLFFVDSDVLVSPDAPQRGIAALVKPPGADAVIGSYDDAPSDPGFISQYKNLFHHYTHQRGNEDASTFWGACGVVFSSVFRSVGGFDESYGGASIEDIALGGKLKKAGYRIRLDKLLRVKHLKRWSAFSMVRSDFFDRALPWSRLILREGRGIPDDLNTRVSTRIGVGLVFLLWCLLLMGTMHPLALGVAAVPACALLLLHRDLYGFFLAGRGPRFALLAIPWHWIYLTLCGAAFALAWLGEARRRLRAAREPVEAGDR